MNYTRTQLLGRGWTETEISALTPLTEKGFRPYRGYTANLYDAQLVQAQEATPVFQARRKMLAQGRAAKEARDREVSREAMQERERAEITANLAFDRSTQWPLEKIRSAQTCAAVHEAVRHCPPEWLHHLPCGVWRGVDEKIAARCHSSLFPRLLGNSVIKLRQRHPDLEPIQPLSPV